MSSLPLSGSRRDRAGQVMRKLWKDRAIYLIFLPVLIWYVMFCYVPMYGITMAFKDYNVYRGLAGSPWVGLKYFKQFFESKYCFRLIRNTFLISAYGLIFGFPAPILLALLFNEIRSPKFKKAVQTISYLPHFVSSVVIVSMFVQFLSPSNGLINNLRRALGMDSIYFLADARYFRSIYTIMGIWRGVGWGTIIYLAALLGVNPELYEACIIDGGGRLRQTWHVTLPGISGTIIVMLILRVGELLSVGSESIILMYSPAIYETADVISTYVYRRGLVDADYSFGAAVGLFNSIVNLILVAGTNAISKHFSQVGLW